MAIQVYKRLVIKYKCIIVTQHNRTYYYCRVSRAYSFEYIASEKYQLFRFSSIKRVQIDRIFFLSRIYFCLNTRKRCSRVEGLMVIRRDITRKLSSRRRCCRRRVHLDYHTATRRRGVNNNPEWTQQCIPFSTGEICTPPIPTKQARWIIINKSSQIKLI